jgi:transcription antitermination factor NusG
VERPILGQYLFVEVDHPRQSYSTVNAIPDVDHMVSNLGAPIPFPRHWVANAIRRYMTGEFDEVAQGPIPVGAEIRIMEGEFNEQLATVVSVKGLRVDFKLHGDAQVRKISEASVRAA